MATRAVVITLRGATLLRSSTPKMRTNNVRHDEIATSPSALACLAALIHTLGLIDALFLAVTFSCAFPTVADKYAFVLEQGARITSM